MFDVETQLLAILRAAEPRSPDRSDLHKHTGKRLRERKRDTRQKADLDGNRGWARKEHNGGSQPKVS